MSRRTMTAQVSGRFVLVLVLERGYSYGLALQLCGSALSELHPRSGLQALKARLKSTPMKFDCF